MSFKDIAVKNLIFAILVSLLLVSCKEEPDLKEAPPTLVRAMTLGDTDQGVYREYPGRVSASQKVDMAFEVSGRVIELPAKEGEQVEKETLLAVVDPSDYEQAYNQENARFQNAKAMFDRYSTLVKSGTVSKAEFDEKETEYKVAIANLATAKKALDDTKLYAPFSGFIARRYIENYQYVKEQQPIISIQNIEELEIVVHVPERDVTEAHSIQKSTEPGKDVISVGKVSFASFPNEDFKVNIKEFATESDPNTQTYRLTVTLPMPKGKIILPGMTATVKILYASDDKDTFLLPLTAIETDEHGKFYAWLINKESNEAKKQIVQVGEIQDDKIEVREGVNIGDRIITAGVKDLRDGMKVREIQGKIGN